MRKPLRVEERRVRSFDGTELAYHVVGEGPPVLLCNGLGGSWKAWTHQIAYLSDRYRFISWDYRGLYRSGRPSERDAIRVEHHARDAICVLNAEGCERVCIFGWSMGVQVALEMFRRAPDRVAGLVMLSGVAGKPWDTVMNLKLMAQVLPFTFRTVRAIPRVAERVTRSIAGWPETIDWVRRLGLASKTLDQEVFQDLCDSIVELDMDLYFHTLELLGEHDATDVLAEVDVPSLVIVGDRDLFTPRSAAEKLARAVAGSELMVIPGGTHYCAVEYPELVSLRIEKFLRERGYASKSRIA